MERVIGIDIGGTKIAGVALQLGTGQILDERVVSTPQRGDELGLALKSLVDLLGSSDPVGIAVPAPVDVSGAFAHAPNLPGLAELGDPAAVGQLLGTRVIVGNDAKCAALAESRLGAGAAAGTVLFVAVGTGIGAGVVIDGRVQVGVSGAAGELGHVQVNSEGSLCGCGRRGCVEAVASGRVLASAAERLYGVIDGRVVVNAARDGDKSAIAEVEQWADSLVSALAAGIFMIDPDLVLLGGGVFDPAEPVLGYVTEALGRSNPGPRESWPPVRAATLGNRAASIGAALLAAPVAAASQEPAFRP